VPWRQGPEAHENGRFACLMNPEGNKAELWESMGWDEKNKASGTAGLSSCIGSNRGVVSLTVQPRYRNLKLP